MATLNISHAARATGKARSTIKQWIESGKLSVTRDGAGHCMIDTAELERVGWLVKSAGEVEVPGVGQLLDEVKDLKTEILVLRTQLEAERKLSAMAEAQVTDTRQQLQRVWEEYFEIKNQMKVLSAPKADAAAGPQLEVLEGKKTSVEPEKKRGFWSFLRAA